MARAAKKTGRKVRPNAAKRAAKDVDLQEVRQRVRNVVGAQAEEIARAVVEDTVKKAQVQPMKILFEMIGLFGAEVEPETPPEDDQALAKALLDRFNLPDVPAAQEERAPLAISTSAGDDSVE